jgi:hypothetical protein
MGGMSVISHAIDRKSNHKKYRFAQTGIQVFIKGRHPPSPLPAKQTLPRSAYIRRKTEARMRAWRHLIRYRIENPSRRAQAEKSSPQAL